MRVIRDIRNSRRLPGVERIWLPGEQSHAKLLDRRAHGVPMPKALRDSLDAVAREFSHRAAGVTVIPGGPRPCMPDRQDWGDSNPLPLILDLI